MESKVTVRVDTNKLQKYTSCVPDYDNDCVLVYRSINDHGLLDESVRYFIRAAKNSSTNNNGL